jgi:hypothetical protein
MRPSGVIKFIKALLSLHCVTDDAVVIGGGDMNIHCVDIKTGRHAGK